MQRMVTTREERDFQDTCMNGFLDEVLDWVANYYAPDDVFEEDVLRQWALDNGFVEEE